MPESPYYLVQKGNLPKAEHMLQRLSNGRTNIQAQLNHIVATVEAERAFAAETEKASFIDCFKGTEWRRTRIILICNYLPQVVGATLSANAPYFLNQTGMASHTVVMLIQVGISFGVASSILNIYLMMKLSHRPLMFFGVTLDVVLFLIMGIAGCFGRNKSALL
jgi:SP family general alpha glucoside:H+ symporter-like MFS transporter